MWLKGGREILVWADRAVFDTMVVFWSASESEAETFGHVSCVQSLNENVYEWVTIMCEMDWVRWLGVNTAAHLQAAYTSVLLPLFQYLSS